MQFIVNFGGSQKHYGAFFAFTSRFVIGPGGRIEAVSECVGEDGIISADYSSTSTVMEAGGYLVSVNSPSLAP